MFDVIFEVTSAVAEGARDPKLAKLVIRNLFTKIVSSFVLAAVAQSA